MMRYKSKKRLYLVTFGNLNYDHLAAHIYEHLYDVLVDGTWRMFKEDELNFEASLTCTNHWCGRQS